jgi:diadenosine tetraphosphate (Ap4A) HIT family hydrolase
VDECRERRSVLPCRGGRDRFAPRPLGTVIPMADDWRYNRIGAARRGENPTVLRELRAGYAVIGDVQFLPGYCVLLVNRTGIDRLTDLPRSERRAFLEDMEHLGEAVERTCARRDPAFRRVNLEILGNSDPYLHAHVWPRYDWEPGGLARYPVWLHPWERWTDPETLLGDRHDDLRRAITDELDRLRALP